MGSAAQELTWQQDEAASDLKRVMRENMRIVLSLRSGQSVTSDEVRQLVESTDEALKNCLDTKVPDSYSFETTNYADNSKVSFTIKEIRNELIKWKAAQSKTSKLPTATEDKSKKDQAQYDGIAGNLISAMKGRGDFFNDAFVKKLRAGDSWALQQLEEYGKFRIPTRMDLKSELQNCINAGIPDSYVFNLDNGKKLTMAQLKIMVPQWASEGEAAVYKADPSLMASSLSEDQRKAKILFENAFVGAMNDMRSVQRNENVADWAHYQKWTVTPLKSALVEAQRVQLPPNLLIGVNSPISFSEAAKKAETFEKDFKLLFDQKDDPIKVFKNTQPPANLARYEKFRSAYTKGLTGDKLLLMDEILITNVVYAQDPPKFLEQYYTENKVPINSPEDFAKAKIWATTNYVYANTDVLKTDPHWRVYISHFDGMKLINTTSKRGSGTTAPLSEFKRQTK